MKNFLFLIIFCLASQSNFAQQKKPVTVKIMTPTVQCEM